MSDRKIAVPANLTIDDLIGVFERRVSEAASRRAQLAKIDSTLPRVPAKVEDLTVNGDGAIAHFLHHFENPPEVIGKLTLAIPSSVQKPARTKAKSQAALSECNLASFGVYCD